jgi:3-deoxy-D-manno-octulosonic acid kinase
MGPVEEDPETQAVRDRYGVPDGLRLRVDGREVLAWVPEEELAVRRVAAEPATLEPSGVAGRAPLARVDGSRGPLLVRRYRKGGLLRHLRGPRFLGRWRPLEELVLHRALLGAGVPVPEAVGCVVLRSVLGWRGYLLLVPVPHAQDLESCLYGEAGEAPPPGRDVLRRAGEVVRRLHDAGVEHADLHPRNLLVDRAGAVTVLDLDRARRHDGPLATARRLANLARLGRAVEKHRLRGLRAGAREALRFLQGYAGNRKEARAWYGRVRARLRRGLALRVLWWRLAGAARPRRAAGGAP